MFLRQPRPLFVVVNLRFVLLFTWNIYYVFALWKKKLGIWNICSFHSYPFIYIYMSRRVCVACVLVDVDDDEDVM